MAACARIGPSGTLNGSRIMAHVLIADAAMGVRAFYAEILEEAGHTAVTAEHAAQASGLRRHSPVDLTLLDTRLPGDRTVDLLRAWSLAGQWMEPVILLCNPADQARFSNPHQLGAVAMLQKPVPQNELLRVVAHILSSRPRAAARPAQTPALPARLVDMDTHFDEARSSFEQAYLAFHLAKNQGNLTLTAQTTQLDRTTLYRKLRKFGMSPDNARARPRGATILSNPPRAASSH